MDNIRSTAQYWVDLLTGRKGRSLMAALMIGFAGVSLLAIAIIATTAIVASRIEMVRYMNDLRYQTLVDELADYYSSAGTFAGAEGLLKGASNSGSSKGHEFILVDTDGTVIYSMVPSLPAGFSSPNIMRFGLPIISGGNLAGYLVALRPAGQPYGDVSESIRHVQNSMRLGVVLAALLALGIGWLFSRRILRPIHQLDAATQLVAQGDLEQHVPIGQGDEIGRLSESFNRMTKSLLRSRDLRQQMTADIAHELRNPLTIILGSAEAISEGVLPPTRQAFEVIYDEAKHLSVIVDDLRTLSLSEDGELVLHKTDTDLTELIRKLPAIFSVQLAAKNVVLDVAAEPGLPLVNVDPDRILQVISNLVVNALRHGANGGRVWVTAERIGTQNAPTGVLVQVNDNGAGIPMDEIPFIFERFYRARKGNRLKDGTGLGLAICRSLVENHGGSVSVESQPGVRTTFSITLPIT